jgi:hypothetical protein
MLDTEVESDVSDRSQAVFVLGLLKYETAQDDCPKVFSKILLYPSSQAKVMHREMVDDHTLVREGCYTEFSVEHVHDYHLFLDISQWLILFSFSRIESSMELTDFVVDHEPHLLSDGIQQISVQF